MQLKLFPTVPMFVGLDMPDVRHAEKVVEELGNACNHYKIGCEMMEHPHCVYFGRELKQQGKIVFWDKKLHDVAGTFQRTLAAAASNEWDYFTVHCTNQRYATSILKGLGGSPMQVMGVTVLTDQNQLDLCDAGLGGFTPDYWVEATGEKLYRWGLSGAIAPAQHIPALRGQLAYYDKENGFTPRPFTVISPGIRLPGDEDPTQPHSITPQQAIENGADWLVVGKPITYPQNGDRLSAYLRYADEVQQAVAERHLKQKQAQQEPAR